MISSYYKCQALKQVCLAEPEEFYKNLQNIFFGASIYHGKRATNLDKNRLIRNIYLENMGSFPLYQRAINPLTVYLHNQQYNFSNTLNPIPLTHNCVISCFYLSENRKTGFFTST